MSGTGIVRLRRRWKRIDGMLLLPLPDGRFGRALPMSEDPYFLADVAAGTATAADADGCWYAAVLTRIWLDRDAGEYEWHQDGYAVDWQHRSERAARLALEDQYFPEPG